MQTQAAILIETGQPLEHVDLTVSEPTGGQVLVELTCSGVCHTQLLEQRGLRGPDRFLPHCLGHEGSGTVVAIGDKVTRVKPGDRVVLSWIKGPGENVPGVQYDWAGRTVNAGGVTTFQRHALVSENRLTLIPGQVAMDQAALLGCAAPTGIGAVRHTGQAGPDEAVAVIGCGGVGLCAIAGARAIGCRTIIGIDVHASRLETARQLGATQTVQVSPDQPIDADDWPMSDWQPVDLVIEATGRCEVMAKAMSLVRPQGGRVVLVGNAPKGDMIRLDPGQFNQGKQLRGTWGGDTKPDQDIPTYANWLTEEKLPLAKLIDRTYTLDQAQQALDDLASGKAIRPLIDMTAT